MEHRDVSRLVSDCARELRGRRTAAKASRASHQSQSFLSAPFLSAQTEAGQVAARPPLCDRVEAGAAEGGLPRRAAPAPGLGEAPRPARRTRGRARLGTTPSTAHAASPACRRNTAPRRWAGTSWARPAGPIRPRSRAPTRCSGWRPRACWRLPGRRRVAPRPERQLRGGWGRCCSPLHREWC